MTYTQLCPRCDQPNRCGFSENPKNQGCWCTELKVPETLKKQIQDEWGDTSCLCQSCLTDLIEESPTTTN